VVKPDGAPEWMMNFLIRFLWPQGTDSK
jgi:hypothetical protein